MTVNYQESPLKDWLHRWRALTILCLILGKCALFSRAITTVPRHGQEVCWVPKYGRNSTDTKRGGGGSIRTMTQKGKVLPEPRRLPPANTCWCSQPGTATRLASRSGLEDFPLASCFFFFFNTLGTCVWGGRHWRTFCCLQHPPAWQVWWWSVMGWAPLARQKYAGCCQVPGWYSIIRPYVGPWFPRGCVNARAYYIYSSQWIALYTVVGNGFFFSCDISLRYLTIFKV